MLLGSSKRTTSSWRFIATRLTTANKRSWPNGPTTAPLWPSLVQVNCGAPPTALPCILLHLVVEHTLCKSVALSLSPRNSAMSFQSKWPANSRPNVCTSWGGTPSRYANLGCWRQIRVDRPRAPWLFCLPNGFLRPPRGTCQILLIGMPVREFVGHPKAMHQPAPSTPLPPWCCSCCTSYALKTTHKLDTHQVPLSCVPLHLGSSALSQPSGKPFLHPRFPAPLEVPPKFLFQKCSSLQTEALPLQCLAACPMKPRQLERPTVGQTKFAVLSLVGMPWVPLWPSAGGCSFQNRQWSSKKSIPSAPGSSTPPKPPPMLPNREYLLALWASTLWKLCRLRGSTTQILPDSRAWDP